MKMIRDVLVILASLALVIFVSDEMATKYKTDDNMISCSYDPVQDLLISVATKEVKNSVEKQGFTFSATFDRDYTVKENDSGTNYWVQANKITEYEITKLMK